MNLYITFFLFLSNLNLIYCSLPYFNSSNTSDRIRIIISVCCSFGEDNYIEIPNNTDFNLSILDEYYFNNIIKFDRKKYQAGNFATNKIGDLILELFENTDTTTTRLFYGLTKEGKYLFSNESSYTYEINMDEISNAQRVININEKSNSFNLFVSIGNKENEYLFSFNYYNSLIDVELYDFNNNNNEYYKLNIGDFVDYGKNILLLT